MKKEEVIKLQLAIYINQYVLLRNKFFDLFFIIAIKVTDCELVYIKNDANNSPNNESDITLIIIYHLN